MELLFVFRDNGLAKDIGREFYSCWKCNCIVCIIAKHAEAETKVSNRTEAKNFYVVHHRLGYFLWTDAI